MRITAGRGRSTRSAIFLTLGVILIAFASVLLLVSLRFGFTAGEIMVNPNARPEDKIKLERAGNFAFGLFAAVQVALTFLILKSGVLKTRWHAVLRAAGVLIAGVLVSCLLVFLILVTGVLPSPLSEIDHIISAWVQRVV